MSQDSILQKYRDFNVYQLMRLLIAGQPDGWPIEKRLRFRGDLSLGFPAHEFSSITVRKARLSSGENPAAVSGEIIEIETANYSMASLLGPLPEPFAEWVRDLKQLSEPAMADFLDIFNQRLNILRFQLKQAQTIGLNRINPEQTDQAKALGALCGLGLPQLQAVVPMPARSWLSLAGLLANCRKSATMASHVLNLIFNSRQATAKTKVRLIPLIGAWQEIDMRDHCKLGLRNQQLGKKSVLGRRVWDQQARVRIAIDNIDFDAFCELLPPDRVPLATQNSGVPVGAFYQQFLSILMLLMDRLVDCEIELNVDPASIPMQRQIQGMRLSRTAWLNNFSGKSLNALTRQVVYLIPAHEANTLHPI